MKELDKVSSVLILFALILSFSSAHALYVVGENTTTPIKATITVGNSPEGMAYDSGTGEFFVAC